EVLLPAGEGGDGYIVAIEMVVKVPCKSFDQVAVMRLEDLQPLECVTQVNRGVGKDLSVHLRHKALSQGTREPGIALTEVGMHKKGDRRKGPGNRSHLKSVDLSASDRPLDIGWSPELGF